MLCETKLAFLSKTSEQKSCSKDIT